MESLRFALVAVMLCCVHAYQTTTPCRDPQGRPAYRWSQCFLCSVQNCRCVLNYRHGLRAECDLVVARSVPPPPGCHIGEPTFDGPNINCCPIVCPEPERCVSSFGERFQESETWNECSPGRSCCTKTCECVRELGGALSPVCFEACPGIQLRRGCTIIEPFQNATHRDCCRTQCDGQITV